MQIPNIARVREQTTKKLKATMGVQGTTLVSFSSFLQTKEVLGGLGSNYEFRGFS